MEKIVSGMVAVNYTILTYAAIIVIGGSVLGLALYFLASSARERYSSNQYHNHQYANAIYLHYMGGVGFTLLFAHCWRRLKLFMS